MAPLGGHGSRSGETAATSLEVTDPGPLAAVVESTAAGRLLPGVQRCLLHVRSPAWPGGWTGAGGGGGRPATERSSFRIASVSKVATATSLLALCDRGQCRLEDRLADHLPADVVDRVHVLEGRSYGPTITLRQLLDHTSGLANFFAHPSVLAAVLHGGGGRAFAPLDLLELAVALEPSFPPGAGRAYTDTGFLLAGLIVERLTGEPLQGAYRRLVLDPAGMGDTWLESSDEAPRGGPVMAHEFDGRDISDMDVTVDWAGGGLVSTARDLAALLVALRDGRLVGGEALQEMTTWAPGPPGFYDDYGLGLGRYRIGAAQLIGHHGIWGAFAFWSPELDAVITGTVNTGRIDRRPLLAAVVAALGAEASPGPPRERSA